MIQTITYRLHDSLPADLVRKWRVELGLTRKLGEPTLHSAAEAELRKRMANYEDAGHGACWLRDERVALIVEQAMLHFDGRRYRLLAWCVMPNHVHAMIETVEGISLSDVLHSWKSYTANQANAVLGRQGEFWQREYHDRYIRDAEHYAKALHYIEENPVKSGLVKQAVEWSFSSVHYRNTPISPGSAGILPAVQPPAPSIYQRSSDCSLEIESSQQNSRQDAGAPRNNDHGM